MYEDQTMNLFEEAFRRKRPDPERLSGFGFVRSEDGWRYEEDLPGGSFRAVVTVSDDGTVSYRLYDLEFEEEYTQAYASAFMGSHIRDIRGKGLAVAQRIAEKCFDDVSFIFPQTNAMDLWIRSTFRDVPDHPFSDYPSYTSYRYPSNRKWYALVMDIPRHSLEGEKKDDETVVEVVNVRIDPSRKEDLLKDAGIYPAYHMNKDSWVSVLLDGSVSDRLLHELVTFSRRSVAGNASGTVTGAGIWIVPSNPRMYDIVGAFERSDEISWKQSSDIHVGDTIYMYVGAPVSAVKYRCTVTRTDIPYSFRDGSFSIKRLMRIRKEETYPDSLLPFSKLPELGIRAVRGPRHVTKEFLDFLSDR